LPPAIADAAAPRHRRHFVEVIASMDVIASHGARIPMLGFGTMTLKEDVCVQLVDAALRLGYRLRTSKRERLPENLGSLDFTLNEAERAEIAKLKRADSRIVSPPQAPKWDI
jgi:diketogulonate reductase-like aldo/keto reductase